MKKILLGFGTLYTKPMNSLTPAFTFAFLVVAPLSLTTAKSKLDI
jgi:hypothetical protein